MSVIKFIVVSLAGKDFQNCGPKQNVRYSALVEDFDEKQVAECELHREAFNLAKHAKRLPGKNYRKLFKSYAVEKFANAAGNNEWRRLNTLSGSLLS